MSKKILGVKVDDVSGTEALVIVSDWLENKKSSPKLITTVGPEFIVTAQKDEEFKEILASADLSLPDGVGLNLLAEIRNRVPGTDFMLLLFREAAKHSWSVGLLGGGEGVARKTAEEFRSKYPSLKVKFDLDGAEADKTIRHVHSTNQELRTTNSELSCDLLFVALGHPKQEKILQALRMSKKPLINYRVGMGVGGAFDYISGNVPRAPAVLRELGMEWVYRVVVERPGKRLQRLKRVFKATIFFPLMILKERLLRPME